MKLDIILKELRKDNWLTGITFIEDNREYLQALVDKTEEQLQLYGVGRSLIQKCRELNIDPECVLLEYDIKQGGFDILYDEGIEEVYLARKGFIKD